MAKTVGLYLRDEIEKEIRSRGENRSWIISRDLERLYALYRRAIRETPLEYREACLIVDALNGSIMDANTATMLWASIEDACKLDGLDKKWEVDGSALVEKLRGLNVLQAMALIDAAERVWGVPDGERDFEKDIRKYFNISD